MKKNDLASLKAGKFLSIMKERKRRFKTASTNKLPQEYSVNALAKRLHPEFQFVRISRIEDHSDCGVDCKTFTFSPAAEYGTTELAYFAAGKYISVFLEIDGIKLSRGYSLCSSPKESLSTEEKTGFYQITVKAVNQGLASRYILDNWKEGQIVKISAPEGTLEYISLRDAPTVVCIAGGSGITPFLSMAKAISEGTEAFNMVLLYGSRNVQSILFKNELDELQKNCKKIKVVHVLSDETEQLPENEVSVFEKGFISGDLIQKYGKSASENGNFSVFMCGPQVMYNFVDKELEKSGLAQKYIRHEIFGEIHSAKTQPDYVGSEVSSVEIKVTVCDETKVIQGNPDDTILQNLEKNGIQVPVRCRSGECGWCHTLLKSGKVYIPAKMEFRRRADLKYGYIHPCCTFPLSDIEIDVPPVK